MGYLAIKYEHRKSFFMHLAVIVGLVMFIGGLDLIRTLLGDSIVFNNFWADLSKLFLLIFGGFHTYLCISSFRHIRRLREKNNLEI